jgi:hypothetical protein
MLATDRQLINPASVKVTTCRLGRSSTGHQAVQFQSKVTNTTMLSGRVTIEVLTLNQDHTVINIDYLVADNVQPGQTVRINGALLTEYNEFPHGKVMCNVKSATVEKWK